MLTGITRIGLPQLQRPAATGSAEEVSHPLSNTQRLTADSFIIGRMTYDGPPFIGPPPPGRSPTPRSPSGRRARVRRGAVLVLAALVAVYGIAWGASNWWRQHSGTAARVEIVKCTNVSKNQLCDGVWRTADGTQNTVTIDGETNEMKQGDIVDVHIHGNKAYRSNLLGVFLPVLLGFGFLGSVIVINRRRLVVGGA